MAIAKTTTRPKRAGVVKSTVIDRAAVLKGNRTASTPRCSTEPLLPLWRTVRAAWAVFAERDEGDGPTLKAYRAAHDAFHRVEPTTTLGLFLTLLDSDAGDNFADDHPAAVNAIIAQLQAANVPLRSLAKTKRGDE